MSDTSKVAGTAPAAKPSAEHTPDGVRVGNDTVERDLGRVIVTDSVAWRHIATVYGADDDRDANAQRFAAAWNAVKVIPTEALELSIVEELIVAAEGLAQMRLFIETYEGRVFDKAALLGHVERAEASLRKAGRR